MVAKCRRRDRRLWVLQWCLLSSAWDEVGICVVPSSPGVESVPLPAAKLFPSGVFLRWMTQNRPKDLKSASASLRAGP